MTEKKTFYLIDASSYIYRAFYGVKGLTNSRGVPTNAVFGFEQMLMKVLNEKNPDYLCAVFDSPHPTFRHEMYEPYKAKRQKQPEDLSVQIPYIKDLVRFHGAPSMEERGLEADDLIAGLARRAREHSLRVVIVSGDKDLHQLVEDPDIVQWDPQRDRLYTEEGVEERFGVKPARIADYLALVGDSSDNVPGVPGVGEKTASKLIREWGSLDDIYTRIDEVEPAKLRSKLIENRRLAYLSRDLVILDKNLPGPFDPSDFVPSPPMKNELLGLYRELDFKGFLEAARKAWGETGFVESPDAEKTKAHEADASATIEDGATGRPPRAEKSPRRDRIVRSEEELAEIVTQLSKAGTFSIDLETTSRDAMLAKIVGIALSWENHNAVYIPVAHNGPGSETQISADDVLRTLGPLIGDPKAEKVGQNLKYEWMVLRRCGVDLKGIAFDTMVASYLLNPGSLTHRLERISEEHLNEEKAAYTDVAGKGKEQVEFAGIDVSRAAEYACGDAETTWRLVPVLDRKLRESKLDDLYRTLELPLIEVLASMEYKGVLVDVGELATLSLDLEKAMEQKADIVYRMAGAEFNIQSPKQLAFVLFEKMGLQARKKTKSGPSTDMSVLEELAAQSPIAAEVLAYRSLSKLKGTYADALPKLIHPETGRIHTSYNQTVTATGRLSSSNPNLQNIPIRSEEGRKIRAAFIPAAGNVLLSADYSQIELRILAHYSRDERLVEAFLAGEDVHRQTAAQMFGVAPEDVDPEMRRQAKTINFGIIYGMGAFGLAKQLRITNARAKEAIRLYFDRYHGVKRFIESTIESTCAKGYCETLLGRTRAIPELRSRNGTIRQQGERLAVNTTIQGASADLIKKAMLAVAAELERRSLKSSMILQVHDELVFEVPEDELDAMKALAREKMEGVWDLAVPLKVDLGWGKNWADAHP